MNKKNKTIKKRKIAVKKQLSSTEVSLTTTKKTYDIDKPYQMVHLATLLKKHIIKNELYATIAGRNYVMVEGWQFAGGLLGMLPNVAEVKEISPNKWLAKVEIINQKTLEIVSTGFALCSKEEMKKKTFDEYAILSMAQTRAIGKAYRNTIGWIMKIAGYESTPAEEMVNTQPNNIEDSKISKVVQMIAAQKNRLILAQWRHKITDSSIYTKKQKKQLIKCIDEQVEKI